MLRLSLAVLAVLTPAWAGAWRAENRLEVNPISEAVFEVIGRPGSGGPDYWCAAGDYAFRVLGAASNARVYLVRGRAGAVTSNRRSAVHFSLTPPSNPEGENGLSLSVTRVGENLSIASAQNYCNDFRVIDF